MSSHDNPRKSFYLRTFGCKVNQYESQAIREMLLRGGYREAASRDAADIYIVNTCTVTAGADKDSRYYVTLLRRANPRAGIVLTGCLANRDPSLAASLPGVIHVVRNEDKPRLAAILAGGPLSRSATCPEPPPDGPLAITRFKDRTKAFLKIQDGCENFCAYCTVPYVRGRFRSKPVENVIDEVRALAGNGFREIVLTGICLGAWGQDLRGQGIGEDAGIIEVLRAIEAVGGDFRIRLSSLELKYVTDGLLDYMARSRRICRHLHIPLQSGDDGILAKMNRPYAAGAFLDVVERARSRIPGLAVSTDVMVGFPGETDGAFRNTVRCVQAIAPVKAHIFTFSKREGTAAWAMGPAVGNGVMKDRRQALEAAAAEASYRYRLGLAGVTAEVLVESTRDRETGLLAGYSDTYVRIRFDGPDALMRRVVPVTVTDVAMRATTGAWAP